MATIVYLDQSILSNLVKYRRGQIQTSQEADIYRQLENAIQNCNRRGCHVFPESLYHMNEAEFDSRLSEGEWRYLKNISCGLEFEHPTRIVNVQMQCALDHWLDKSQQQRINWKSSWAGIFNRDPHEPLVPDPHRFYVRFGTSPALLKHDRRGKSRLPEMLQKIAPVTSMRTSAEQTELERMELIKHLFVPSMPNVSDMSATINLFADLLIPSKPDRELDVSDVSINEIVNLVDYNEACSRWKYLKRQGLSPAQAVSFFQSRELATIPMVDIWAKLWGHLMSNAVRRIPQSGDASDIGILAMTLPYCDIVTTDGYMQKVVVQDLKLADSYQALVLSAKLKDIKKLIAVLAN